MPYRIRRLFRAEALIVGFGVIFVSMFALLLLLAVTGMVVYMLTGHDIFHMALQS